MKFKHHLVYDNSEDIGYMLEGGDYNLSCLVVDTTLENLQTKKKQIVTVKNVLYEYLTKVNNINLLLIKEIW